MKKRLIDVVIGLTSAFAIAVPSAHAVTVLDLTVADSSGFIDTAFYQQINPKATGSGVINPFVRISANTDIEQGYNTDGRPTAFDENSSPTFTHSLLLSSVPTVTLDGITYRQFLLDINQTGEDPLLSLDSLQIYLNASDGSLTTTTLSSLGALVYDLDASGDNWIKLNYSLNTGSGSGDMFAYIPDSRFTGPGTQFVYLYSKFGVNENNNDGYEEWAILGPGTPTCDQTGTCPPIPEPTSLLLMGTGLVGALGLRASRKRM